MARGMRVQWMVGCVPCMCAMCHVPCVPFRDGVGAEPCGVVWSEGTWRGENCSSRGWLAGWLVLWFNLPIELMVCLSLYFIAVVMSVDQFRS
jgi:hypothetical protein